MLSALPAPRPHCVREHLSVEDHVAAELVTHTDHSLDLSNGQFSAPRRVARVAASGGDTCHTRAATGSKSSKRPRKSRERDARNGRTIKRLDPRWGGTRSATSAEVETAALKDPRGAKTYLHERIARGFKRWLPFPVDFVFVLEFTDNGRLHVHGVAVVDQTHKHLTTRALMEAGGKWRAAHPEFQADIRKLWCGDGWANYCDKMAARTRAALGLKNTASVMSATQNLRAMGEAYWVSLRETERLAQKK